MNWLRMLLWINVGLLSVIGLIMLISNTATMGSGAELNFSFLIKQGAALVIGLIAALIVSAIGCKRYHNGWVVLAIAIVIAVLLAAVPLIGREINGARRWIDLGPINLQPSELAKLGIIIIAAWYFSRIQEKIRLHGHGIFLPCIAFVIYAALIYRTKDFGSIVVLGGIMWTMLFFAGARWMYLTTVSTLLLPLVAYVAVFMESYRRERLTAFWDPWTSDSTAAYHLRQSSISIGSGGWNGQGLGEGASKGHYLPERHTDFVYAVISEETGFIGAVFVAFLYFMFVMIGMLIANKMRDRFRRLIAVGATSMIGLQAFWNMMVVTGMVPTKGLTLPFISYGGTSVVVCMIAVGLLDAVVREKPIEELAKRGTSIRIGAATTRRLRRPGKKAIS